MSEQSGTQTVEAKAPANLVLAALKGESANFNAKAPAVETTVTVPPVANATEVPVTNAAPTTATPVADPAPTTDAPASPETADPYAAVVGGMFGEVKAAPTWTDEAKAAYKALYGVDDPIAHKAEIDARFEQANLLKTQYEQGAPILEKLKSLQPQTLKAFEMLMDGKIAEAQAYIKSTPESILGNREAKSIPERDLVNTYCKDKDGNPKITDDQWDMLKDPEADPDLVDALKTRIGLLKEYASDLHESSRTKALAEKAQEDQARQAYGEKLQAMTAASISKAKNSPLAAFVDQGTIEEVSTGRFLGRYVNQDGTPTEDGTTLHLWALHGPKLVQAAEERGFQRGQQKALQEATSRQPAGATGSGRSAGDTPRNLTEADQIRMLTLNATRTA